MNKKTALAVIELGGYPNFTPLYEQYGYAVTTVTTVRKAVKVIKQLAPRLIVAEFNYQSDFRDRTSSLETLLSTAQRLAHTKVVVFYDKEHQHHFQRLKDRFAMDYTLPFPVTEDHLKPVLEKIAAEETS